MKKLYLFTLLLLSHFATNAQLLATTQDGRRIILSSNGTWRYFDSTYHGGGSTSSIHTLYNEAYDYAYDIMYGDEFFSQDRKSKAQQWALQYVKSGIQIPVGYKSLDQWFDELHNFANEHLFRSEFFTSERKNKAVEWAAQIIKEKGYFDDYRLNYITRHRAAFNFAFNKIYKNEFFAQDRRKKALEWANAFCK